MQGRMPTLLGGATAVVGFHGSSLLDGTRVFVADSAGPYVAGDWGGGVAEFLGEDTGFAHGPIVACG